MCALWPNPSTFQSKQKPSATKFRQRHSSLYAGEHPTDILMTRRESGSINNLARFIKRLKKSVGGGCHTHCLSIKHDYKLVTSSLSFFSPCCVFFLSFIFFLSRGQGTLLFGHLTRNCRHSHCPHISSNYAPYSDCLCASPSSPSSISPTMPRRANRPRFFPLFLIPHSNPECCTRKTPIKHSFRAKQIYKYFLNY